MDKEFFKELKDLHCAECCSLPDCLTAEKPCCVVGQLRYFKQEIQILERENERLKFMLNFLSRDDERKLWEAYKVLDRLLNSKIKEKEHGKEKKSNEE